MCKFCLKLSMKVNLLVKFNREKYNLNYKSHIYKSKSPVNISWSWRRLQDVFKTCLEDEFNTSSILRLPSRLDDVLEDVKLLRWRRLEDVLKTYIQDVLKTCIEDVLRTYIADVLKTCIEDVLKTCLEDVLKTCLEDVLKTLWRKTKYLLGIYVSSKSKCVSNKSIFHKIYIWQF